ncbi:MAG TPA: hypothetical protein VE077_05690 [Candidatus Methylomirabilis sp.]|nr:hypothetical protein [Candidatus Methylomirabilis sp.]
MRVAGTIMLPLTRTEGWWATHYRYVTGLVIVSSAIIGLTGGWLLRRRSFWKWWDEYNAIIVGPLLVAVGLLVGTFSEAAILQELRVALVIAGVLAVTVDPLIKGKAHREAVRDVFHHILGFSLPLPIRDRLLDIVKNTTLYRENAAMRVALSESGERLVFDVEMEYEVVNPTLHTEPFQPRMEFETGEHPTLRSVTCFGEPDYGTGATLEHKKTEPSVIGYWGRKIYLASAQRRRFKLEYTMEYPLALGFYIQHFQYPTIGLALTINHSAGLVVTATPAQSQSDGEWRYTRLFMPGDYMQIKWERPAPVG